jgi:hypothetical protein
MTHRLSIALVLTACATAGTVVLPAGEGRRTAADEPTAAALTPPAGGAEENELPATARDRQAALDHLNDVAACVRAKGETVPDPVSDEGGVHLGWDGPPRPPVESAIRACDPALP